MTAVESGSPTPSTVFVVDDDPAVRRSIRMVLDTIKIPVKSYATAAEFLSDYGDGAPGCLVLDVRLPDLGGIQVLQRLMERLGYCPRAIMISGHDDVDIAVTAMKLGAVDFLEKPFAPARLIEQVQLAIARDRADRAARATLKKIRSSVIQLSQRECEVLAMLLEGKSNKEIAANLGVSSKTASSHKTNILIKMGARSVVDLARMVDPLNQSFAAKLRDDASD